MSVISLCRLLPFHAWPLWLRMTVWGMCALFISLAVHSLRIHVFGPSHHGTMHTASLGQGDGLDEKGEISPDFPAALGADMVGLQQHRLDAVRRKVEGLPALRVKGKEAIRCTGQKAPVAVEMPTDRETDSLAVFANDLRPVDASGPQNLEGDTVCSHAASRTGGVMSSAALLAWIEHSVLASDVALRRFEPVAEDLSDQVSSLRLAESMPVKTTMARPSRNPEGEMQHDDFARTDPAFLHAATPLYRAADIEIRGSYEGLYRLLQQFARTEPPLIVLSSRVRSDNHLMRWDARVVVTDAGVFHLGTIPAGSDVSSGATLLADVHGSGGGAAVANSFARSALPSAAQAARLIGFMRLGSRKVGLFAYGSKRYVLEEGAMLGDARIVSLHSEDGTPRAELEPLTGESQRVLLLRNRQ